MTVLIVFILGLLGSMALSLWILYDANRKRDGTDVPDDIEGQLRLLRQDLDYFDNQIKQIIELLSIHSRWIADKIRKEHGWDDNGVSMSTPCNKCIKKDKPNMEIGDTIECVNADDMIDTMQELAKQEIKTDFVYEKR